MSHARRQRPNITLAVLCLGAVAYSLLQSGVAPALPNIQHSLHASLTGASWVFTAYLLSASVGTPILGRLGDMHGKEKWLLYTLIGLAAGTLLAAPSPSASSRPWRCPTGPVGARPAGARTRRPVPRRGRTPPETGRPGHGAWVISRSSPGPGRTRRLH